MRVCSRRIALLGVMAGALATATPDLCGAVELWSDDFGSRSLSLNATLKWTTIVARAPSDTTLFPEEWSAAQLWRFRGVLDARPLDWLACELAYEHSARLVSEGAGEAGGSGILPAEFAAPYRVEQLADDLVTIGETFNYSHELDRASATFSLGRAELKLGRQAVGWGRGLVFSAVDVFAPFTPLESDREWRRGIDALRFRTPVTDLLSVDGVAALGETDDASSFMVRLHGYAGDVDGEILLGRRREDDLVAASVSLPVLDAEAHGEAALFLLPDRHPAGGSFDDDRTALKALVGASRSFDVAAGVMIAAEYHYSGFGVPDIDRATDLISEPAFAERYMVGDSQILGRHAVAARASYGIGGVTPASLTWIVSPVDGSGVVFPSLLWYFSDNVTLSASAYLPHGEPPEAGTIKSEYGGTPASGVLQIGLYF
jgi:hypothetical protein